MNNKEAMLTDILPDQAIFALDIGTRSIIGVVGVPDGDRIRVVAIDRAEHTKRAMIDGQIEDIEQVAKIARQVKDKLEKKLGCRLTKVCVAAAGRALRTESVTFEMELPKAQKIDAEAVSRLEAGAISEAERIFMEKEGRESDRQFYLVGYTVCKYYLDNYIISNLIDHHGRVLKADIIATFLPTEVVESLYAAMHKTDLEVASITLEPIAAINAAIPQNIRLLNLAMVDIGAGTSDIAVCRDGSVTGYTMAILAGDEITENIMREYLVDFDTAEKIKSEIDNAEQVRFTDILGFEQNITRDSVFGSIKEASSRLCEEISSKILEANGGMPSAVFLAGGGSRLSGLKEGIVEHLQIDPKRVAIAGNNYKINAFSEEYDLENPEYATPLGIVISAGLNMINDSFRVILNDRPAKLFRSGTFTVMDILMMNGYNYQDMIGRSGQNLVVNVNGQRQIFYGEKAEPSVLKLNGKEAQLSDQVNAGDKIEFIPARHGKKASAMLSDIAEFSEDKRVFLNNQEVEGDLPIKSGDIIVVENLHTEAPEDKEEQSYLAAQENEEVQEDEEERYDNAAYNYEEVPGDKEEQNYEAAQDYEGVPGDREKRNYEAAQDYIEVSGDKEKRNYEAAQDYIEVSGDKEKRNYEAAQDYIEVSGDKEKRNYEAAQDYIEVSGDKEKRNYEAAQDYEEVPGDREERNYEAAQDYEEEPDDKKGSNIARKTETENKSKTDPQKAAYELQTESPYQKPAVLRPSNEKGRNFIQSEHKEVRKEQVPENNPQSGYHVRRQEVKAVSPTDGNIRETRVLHRKTPAVPGNEADTQLKEEVLKAQTDSQALGSEMKITFYLNDKPLNLPRKPEGKSYYLMDLLEYSGLDFKKVTGPVALEVNGKNGYFQQELRDRDHIRIYQR